MTGLVATFGSGAMTNSVPELENADCILITGSNTTEGHPLIATRVFRAVKKGAKLIVVDPRRIQIAKKANLHLRQKPGSDVAWINGLMHVIIAEGLADEAFIAERTEGYDELEALVAEYTPEKAEAISGIRIIQPDVVILDIRMPGGTGIDVLQTIKQDEVTPMVIILTNYPYPGYRQKCLQAGADFFLDKSAEFDQIPELFERFKQGAGSGSAL